MQVGWRFAEAHAPLGGLAPIDLALLLKRLFKGLAGDEVPGQVERTTVHRRRPVGMDFRDAGLFEPEQGAHARLPVRRRFSWGFRPLLPSSLLARHASSRVTPHRSRKFHATHGKPVSLSAGGASGGR